MARAYAIELRLRVIKAVEAGIRISKVSKLYNGLKKLNKKIVRFAWKEVRIEKIT